MAKEAKKKAIKYVNVDLTGAGLAQWREFCKKNPLIATDKCRILKLLEIAKQSEQKG